MKIEELRKFYEYAKVANPPYNPAEAILCLIKQIDLLGNRLAKLEDRVDLECDDED
jgi:hypothetical protein